jgi:tetratricopeptide (TPR) repeat protein
VIQKLSIFISSTADLESFRDAVESALSNLEADGSRYESWPSSPDDPVTECLNRVSEADGLVLLIGKRYGSKTANGKSVTHLEYRRAKELKRPIFVYLIESETREPEQTEFLTEVRQANFHCRAISTCEELTREVRMSLLREFTRCFRSVHSSWPQLSTQPVMIPHLPNKLTIPRTKHELHSFLQKLFEEGNDLAIHSIADQVEETFRDSPDIMNLIYVAEVNLGVSYADASKRRLEDAAQFWGSPSVVSSFPKDSLRFNRGNALLALGRHSEAVIEYQQYLRSFPRFAPCLKNLGTSQIILGNRQGGLRCLEKAASIDPTLFEALYCLAMSAIQHDQDFEKGLGYLNRIITRNQAVERRASVEVWKAYVLMQQNRYAEGVACAENALEIAPEKRWVWDIPARLYALLRRNDPEWLSPAMTFWQRFLLKFPEEPEAWAELGYIHWFLKDGPDQENHSELALSSFKKALQLGHSDDGLVWDRVGHLHQSDGELTLAVQAFQQATTISPDKFGYCYGVSLLLQKKCSEALPWLLAAAKSNQPDALSWFQVGTCYVELGDPRSAEDAYRKAIETDSEFALAWFDLGGLYWNNKRPVDAIATWSEALKKFPDHELAVKVRDYSPGLR